MSILFLLVPLALGLGGFFILAFFWGVKDGQSEDFSSAKHRMLLEKEE